MRWGVLLSLLLLAPLSQAAQLRDLRVADNAGSTRVVLDLGDTASAAKVFTLEHPDRVVIDLDGVDRNGMARAAAAAPKGYVQRVRSGGRPNGIRIVLDVSTPVSTKTSRANPAGQNDNKLIVDLAPLDPRAASAANVAGNKASAQPAMATMTPPASTRQQEKLIDKPVVIAIDAGHGGEDPGAIGKTGLQEKDVSLAIARKLALLINTQPNMRAVLTRDGDYYVGLRQRVEFARRHQADMFISIHCNALERRSMRGTAVYVLSDRGATSEHARWLASRENAADLVGGVDLHDKDGDLASVLIDLSQSATMEASFDIGGRILRAMGKLNTLQKADVQQAGFMVLKAPDIPSVLVETAFITNPQEEKLLGSDDFQASLANGILSGIRGYFQSYRPKRQMVEATPVRAAPAPAAAPARRVAVRDVAAPRTAAQMPISAASPVAAALLPAAGDKMVVATVASAPPPAVHPANGLSGAAGLRAALRAASYTQVSPVTQGVSR